MEESSQTMPARRQPRPWTEKDQLKAEEMLEQGLSLRAIGRELERGNATIYRHLKPNGIQKAREREKAWRNANPEKTRESRRRWRAANYEAVHEAVLRWQRENKEKTREKSRRYYEQNALQVRKRVRRYQQANPDICNEAKRRRRSLIRSGRQRALLPLSAKQISLRFGLFSFGCAYCGCTDGLTVDHVTALTKGGLDEAANVIPACRPCNSSKRNCNVEEWYRRQPFFTEARWRKIQRHCPAAVVGQLPLALA